MKIKLEIESYRRHKIYANAEWKLEDNELVQIVTLDERTIGLLGGIEFTLAPGDNIKLNGQVFHVVSHQLAYERPLISQVQFHFVYKIQKGKYTPNPWIKIADVEKMRNVVQTAEKQKS